MQGSVVIGIDREGDGSCELRLRFYKDGFSGKGSAHFDLGSFREKSREFGACPLSEQPVILAGGYLDKQDLTRLRQEHLHISAYKLDRAGHVALMVKVAVPADNGAREQAVLGAFAEFNMEYEALAGLSKNLLALADGEIDEFSMDIY